VSIQAVPPVVARVGWAWAFPMLALGPVFGIWSIGRLAALVSGRSGIVRETAPRLPS
jgi:hypothetical protein